jgi:hypothetical protein
VRAGRPLLDKVHVGQLVRNQGGRDPGCCEWSAAPTPCDPPCERHRTGNVRHLDSTASSTTQPVLCSQSRQGRAGQLQLCIRPLGEPPCPCSHRYQHAVTVCSAVSTQLSFHRYPNPHIGRDTPTISPHRTQPRFLLVLSSSWGISPISLCGCIPRRAAWYRASAVGV